jgi:putative two-component system response regulator
MDDHEEAHHFGARILGDSSFELLRVCEIIALSHHVRWDGSGYPNGLAGEDIPLYGRICAVADVFDALTSRRPYKEPFSNEESLPIMRAGRGSHFDPQNLDVFLTILICSKKSKRNSSPRGLPLPQVRHGRRQAPGRPHRGRCAGQHTYSG